MATYYNEHDPFPAQWLRNLIAAGHLPPGDVDERSIVDVRSGDLNGYDQCHFFAGIGGWALAGRIAGLPDDEPWWTGSCPCQPFSAAGKRQGFADERHLWPIWSKLIRECAPPVVFGEQVASPDGLLWLDAVSADVEDAGYAFAASDLCAASVGAPQIRQRFFWVADAGRGPDERWRGFGKAHGPSGTSASEAQQRQRSRFDVVDSGSDGRLGDTRCPRLPDAQSHSLEGSRWRAQGRAVEQPSSSFWAGADWLFCRDSRIRPVEPGTFPLAHGVSGRVGRLRAYGNAIVPSVAAEFIAVCMECRPS